MTGGPPLFFWVFVGSILFIMVATIFIRLCQACGCLPKSKSNKKTQRNVRNMRRRDDEENGVGFSPTTGDTPPGYDYTYGDGFDIHTDLHQRHGIGTHDSGHHSGGHDSGHHDSGGGGDTGGCDSGGGDTGGGCDSGGGGDTGGGCDSGGGGCDSGGGGVD